MESLVRAAHEGLKVTAVYDDSWYRRGFVLHMGTMGTGYDSRLYRPLTGADVTRLASEMDFIMMPDRSTIDDTTGEMLPQYLWASKPTNGVRYPQWHQIRLVRTTAADVEQSIAAGHPMIHIRGHPLEDYAAESARITQEELDADVADLESERAAIRAEMARARPVQYQVNDEADEEYMTPAGRAYAVVDRRAPYVRNAKRAGGPSITRVRPPARGYAAQRLARDDLRRTYGDHVLTAPYRNRRPVEHDLEENRRALHAQHMRSMANVTAQHHAALEHMIRTNAELGMEDNKTQHAIDSFTDIDNQYLSLGANDPVGMEIAYNRVHPTAATTQAILHRDYIPISRRPPIVVYDDDDDNSLDESDARMNGES